MFNWSYLSIKHLQLQSQPPINLLSQAIIYKKKMIHHDVLDIILGLIIYIYIYNVKVMHSIFFLIHFNFWQIFSYIEQISSNY